MKKNIFALALIISLLTPSFPISPIVEAAERSSQRAHDKSPNTQAGISSENRKIPPGTGHLSGKDRLKAVKLRRQGIVGVDPGVLDKIEAARGRANARVAQSSEAKALKRKSANQQADVENFRKDRLVARELRDTLKRDARRRGASEEKSNTKRQELRQRIDDQKKAIALTKKEDATFDQLRDINENLQHALDEELDAVLTPTEKQLVGNIEADYLYELEDWGDDLNDPEINKQWEIGSILTQFPDHFTTPASTSDRILVAIIDTGVDYTHEDLTGHLYNPSVCFDETGTTTSSGCPYGGWDYVDDDNDPSPNNGETHGTQIAGLVAALTGSNLGIASMSSNLVDIMPIRVTSGTQIELSKIIDAIYFAVENDADVINMSFSGPTYSQTLYDAIEYAEQNDVLVVAAAGNYGINLDNEASYPASYDLDNIISVAALNVDHTLASFSNYGKNSVDFAAPGVDLVTTNPNNGYTTVNGTSYSAAITSAMTGALLAQGKNPQIEFDGLEQAPTLTQQTIEGKVLGAAVDLPPSEPIVHGAPSATSSDSFFGDFYIQAKGGSSVASGTYELAAGNPSPFVTAPVLGNPGLSTSYSPPELSGNDYKTFRWNPVSGAHDYGLYIKDVTPGQPEELVYDHDLLGGAYLQWTIPEDEVDDVFEPGHYYRWNMRAWDHNYDYSEYSSVLRFRVAPNTPTTPETYGPGLTYAPGPEISGTSQTFTWEDVGADYYLLNVKNERTGVFLVDDRQVNDDDEIVSTLENGERYTWDIQACDDTYGCGNYSYNRYFIVGGGNSAPNIPEIYGLTEISEDTLYTVTLEHNWDAQGHSVKFEVDWDDGGANTQTSGYTPVGQNDTLSHTYTDPDEYCVRAKAIDTAGESSEWSNCFDLDVQSTATGPDLVGELGMTDTTLSASDYTTLSYDVDNIGDATVTTDFTVNFYLSRDDDISADDDQFLGFDTVTSSIAPSGSVSGSKSVALPDAGHVSYYHGNGDYYIGAFVDGGTAISESNEGNNGSRGLNVDLQRVYINGTQSADVKFNFSSISSPTINTPFNVTISSENPSTYTGDINLISTAGNVKPKSVKLENGQWQGSLEVNSEGNIWITAFNQDGSGQSEPFLVTGPGADDGRVIIKVVDNFGQPISGATVDLICFSGGSTCTVQGDYNETTNQSGVADFGLFVPAGQYKIIATYDGIVSRDQTITVTAGGTNNLTSSVALASDANLTPIVFIPGLIGSTMKNDFLLVPVLNANIKDRKDLKIADRDLDGELGWNAMIDAFEEQYDYRDGKSIIRCPWDWRLKVEDAAEEYLRECILEAKRLNPGKDKVDIVAHSMGGLVARSYIQKSNYTNSDRDDVRKIAFMGTPHQGGTNSYYLWGGYIPTPVVGYTVMRQIDAYYYQDDNKYSLPVNLPNIFTNYQSSLLVDNKGYVKEFIRDKVPSIGQLIPVYDFLVNVANNASLLADDEEVENKFLKTLNNASCFSGSCGYSTSFVSPSMRFGTGKVEAKVFMNSGVDTPHKIVVDPTETRYLEDGDPLSTIEGEGDGTVITDSATWFAESSGISGVAFKNYTTATENDPTKHGRLPLRSMEDIGQYLTGTAFETAGFDLDAIVNDAPTLTLDLPGARQPLLTAPDSSQVGINPTNGDVIETATNIAFMEITGDGSSITLSDPQTGQYSLMLHGSYAEDFDFYLDYVSDEHKEVHMNDMVHDGSTTTITFTLNTSVPSDEAVITFTEASDAPEDLTATKQGSGTLLSWDEPSDGSPTAYRIYSRPVDDSLLEYQAQATTTTYTPGDTWAGSSTTLAHRYQVSAVYPSGEESFLSNIAYNNDEDQDGLPDHLEVEEGTTIGDTDTDNDGLLDGEEYFNYGTDPTLSDTDGDGINDYDEVTPGGTGSSTPSTGAQIYSDALENGWAEYGTFKADYDYSSTGQVTQGSTAIEMATNGTWGGMWIRNSDGLDTTGFKTLRFAYHPGDTVNHVARMKFRDETHEDDSLGDYITVDDYITEDISGGLQSKWYNVVIPLEDLNAVDETVADLILIAENTATFYLDNIYFSSQPALPYTYVYDNALQNGWQQSGSWSVSYDFSEATTTYYDSNASTKLTYSVAWGGLALTNNTGVDGSAHENMLLAYNPGSTGGQTDYIRLRDEDSNNLTSGYISLSNYIPGTPQADEWYQLTIPLDDLGASTSTIGDIIITGSAATTIYLDDIYFTAATSSSTSNPSTSDAVFLEGLVDPWDDGGGWRSSTAFNSTQSKTGVFGIRAEYDDPWSGNTLTASTSVDISGFDTLSIAYNPGATTTQTLYVKLRDDQSADMSGYKSFSTYNSNMPANEWSIVNIPLNDLGATTSDLIKDMIFTTSATATVYFDDIRFTSSTSQQTSSSSALEIVYEDFFQNSWADGGSYLATTTFTSATSSNGVYGIEIEYTDGQWSDNTFSAAVPIDTAGMDTLYLSYNPGATTSHTMYIKTRDENGTNHNPTGSGFIELHDYVTDMQANQWRSLEIPFADLSIGAGEEVKDIIFTTDDGPKVYFDDIHFGEQNAGGDTIFDEGMVSLSFDDGWLTHHSEALDILDAENIDGTFYIVTEETIQATSSLIQLIDNPSLETASSTNGFPEDWQNAQWGTHNATFTYPVAGVDGDDAARIEITSYTDGDAKWFFDDEQVHSNNYYTVSFQYRSDVPIDVTVRFDDGFGNYLYNTPTTTPISTSWSTATATFLTPTSTESITVFPTLDEVGYLEIDNFTLHRDQIYVDADQVLDIEASGHEIGAHTKHHVHLPDVNASKQQDEISGSRTDLLNKIGVSTVTSIAYPYGEYDPNVQNITQSSGYTNGRSTDEGYNYTNTNKYALKIQPVGRTTTLSDIQTWVQTAKQDNTWLILMFHQIDDNYVNYLGAEPAFLEDIADYIANDGITTVTVSEGVGLMD